MPEKLFLLKVKEPQDLLGSSNRILTSVLVRADREKTARALARKCDDSEFKDMWFDLETTSCERIFASGSSYEVILKSFSR